MRPVKIQRSEDKLIIGESPKLVVDLTGGQNYIETENQKIPYRKTIRISADLLQGKRQNVMQTAMSHYYSQACSVAEGYKKLSKYRGKMNTTVKELR